MRHVCMLLRADAGSSAAEDTVRREMEERQDTNRSGSASEIFRSASIPASGSHEAMHVTRHGCLTGRGLETKLALNRPDE